MSNFLFTLGEMTSTLIILSISFFLIALIYASVGFGGGSSYLALLAQPIFLLSPEEIRPTALLCNVMVVTGGTFIFYRENKINRKEVWPFLAASIPFAWIGGFMRLQDELFFILLSLTLITASGLLWIQPNGSAKIAKANNNVVNIALGGGIGFLSGLVSIGGGIFLSPILHLIRWSEAKKISALASLFILVNSISGLAGQFTAGFPEVRAGFLIPLLLAVLIGGQIGSRIGARKLNPVVIKRITAVLILAAGINILADHL